MAPADIPDIALGPMPARAAGVRAAVAGAMRRHPTVALAGALLVAAVLAALLAPWLGTVDPQRIAPAARLKPPSAAFWFGSDMLGRDVYSRTLFGARVSLSVGISVAAISIVAGAAFGIVAGFFRTADAVLMRVLDGLMSIPAVLLAISLMSLTRASMGNVIVAISVAEAPRVARLVRGLVLSLRVLPYVEAAVACGTPTPMILWRHILPGTLAPLMVQGTYIFASAILTEAILSFVGAGTPPNVPSWGNIMAEGRGVFQIAPTIILFPGLCLSLTVLAVNMLGDGLRDALDPRLARRL
jgi:peptide/nickel transport system permease protein